jgi:hypothetical protein
MNNKQNNPKQEESKSQTRDLIDYFNKIDANTREFYIKTILRIYYLLNENK